MFFKASFSLSWTLALSSAVCVVGTPMTKPLHGRGVVSHDSLNPIATRVQAGVNGTAIERFNPRLHIASGCQPYTAVNDNGDTSGGLKPKGSPTGGCRDQTKGQTYARAAPSASGSHFSIMYAWYFPKDQTISGVSTGAHRHDWESVVIIIDNPAAVNPIVLGGAASGHGDFKKTSGTLLGGDSATVEYFASLPTNHELQFTNTIGNTYPISDWDAMPDAAKIALENTDFGGANVPFKDKNFANNLAKAYML